MKKIFVLLSIISFSSIAEENTKTTRYSIGVGVGAIYSGIGANVALVSEHDMKYISAGCTAYSSKTKEACGLGAGWIKTDLFNNTSNKHGFGFYISAVDEESIYYETLHDDIMFRNYREENIYGAGISYTYFLRGIDEPSTNFGVSIHATNAEQKSKFGVFLQVGFQF